MEILILSRTADASVAGGTKLHQRRCDVVCPDGGYAFFGAQEEVAGDRAGVPGWSTFFPWNTLYSSAA